ncbi:hypothetical protein POPTR_008G153602v4 [Populus trichocarpa]|uniref:Uncharacterized protein n=1 Tax=Populus trichocarpa TaxID=3694 RepID=A0ACC0SM17_POPTR|nr:hypothetical protein POPTR_008G153602v4 [Populus trichocarpa]
MRNRYMIESGAEHYACTVDMLWRAGMVELAYEFVQKMPIQNSGNHVLLSNMLVVVERWEEATLVRKELKDVGIKKGAGLSRFRFHLIERSPDTQLPEGPYSAASPVLDPTHLPRGHHVCFSVSNFDSFVQSLKDKGIKTFQRSVPNRPIRQVFFFDPDGNGLEVASRDE